MNKNIIKISLLTILALAIQALLGYNYLYQHGLSGKYANSEAKAGQIKVACIGDSITYGHGIEEWEHNNYPAVLQEILGDNYHVMNFGSSGACVNPNGDQPYKDREVYQESLAYDADVLIFLFGTNDAKAKNWTDMDTFLQDYKELVATYLDGQKQPKVYIGLCTEAFFTSDEEKETGVAQFEIQPHVIDEIVEGLKTVQKMGEYPVTIIDINGMTEGHAEWFEEDGIHPDKAGARAMAEFVAESILSSKK